MDQEPKQQQKRSPLVIVLIIIIVVLVAAAAVLALGKFGENKKTSSGAPVLAYQEGVTALDENSLQKAVDEMYAKDTTGIPVAFKNDAYSTDGKTFSCYIGNPASSPRDVYIGIYKDLDSLEELYLSGLIEPGKVMTEVTLSQKFPVGTHRLVVAYNQVDEDHATLTKQAFITMDFTVK